MQIKLMIDGKEKTFTAPFVNTRRLKETIALKVDLTNKDISEGDKLDKATVYLVDVYGKQFTADELLDGFPANDFYDKAVHDMKVINGDLEDSVKN